MRLLISSSIIVMSVTALCTHAFAQNREQQWAYCENQNDAYAPDLRIGGCTAVIQSGRESQEKLAITFFRRGNAYFTSGDHARAIADYGQAIRINPQYRSAFHLRGDAYRLSGNNVRAIADYDQAIRINPQYAYAYIGRAAARQNLKDFDGALADVDRAARLAPKDWPPPSTRGDFLLARGHYQQAIVSYTQSISLDRSQAWNFAHRGQAHEALNDRTRALADYRQAVRLKSDDAESRKGICRLLRMTGPNADETRAACSK